jgi:hypothetical protein
MRAEAVGGPAAAKLDRLLAELRAGQNAEDRLVALAAELDVDIDLDASRGGTMPALGDLFPSGYILQRYRCPRDRCSRHWIRQPGLTPPSCAVFDGPLAKPEPTS